MFAAATSTTFQKSISILVRAEVRIEVLEHELFIQLPICFLYLFAGILIKLGGVVFFGDLLDYVHAWLRRFFCFAGLSYVDSSGNVVHTVIGCWVGCLPKRINRRTWRKEQAKLMVLIQFQHVISAAI